MRVADKIANKIMTKLEFEGVLKTTKKKYLTTECLIADTITEELSKWLRYDVDLNEVI